MELERFEVIKQINMFSTENNKPALIDLLCKIIDSKDFFNNNKDLVYMIISIGELYGYYTYLENDSVYLSSSDDIRKRMYKSTDGKIYYNSGQLSLLSEFRIDNKIFVSAPTSFGKTKLVLEYISQERNKLNNILFLIPTNSLSEEIYIKLLDFNHKNRLSFHITTNPKILGGKNILILTPEKYLLMLESYNFDFDLYIMDESYKIEEEQNQKEQLNYDDPLNSRSSKFRKTMEIIAKSKNKTIYLSPFTYNADDSMKRFFDRYNVKMVNRYDKYVNKNLIKISDSKDYKEKISDDMKGFLKKSSGIDKASKIVTKLEDTTIIYVRYPKEAVELLNMIDIKINLETKSERYKSFLNHIESTYEFENSNWYILDGLKKGIGIYVSPIPRYIKREIINLFNSRELNILIVTSAFAEGVNSSAKNIIITNDVVSSNVKMTPLDLLNLSGRAGRFGIHSIGNVIAVNEDVHKRLEDSINHGVTISNLNYENYNINKMRSKYDIESIEDIYLNSKELDYKSKIIDEQNTLGLSDDDLNIALSISNYEKIKLYKYFLDGINDDLMIDIRHGIINNIMNSEKSKVVESIGFIFGELKDAGINIFYERGDMPAYSRDESFLWGKFYGIHSSGSIKDVLKSRKRYIENEYNIIKEKNYGKIPESSWICDYVDDNQINDFKLYNQAFRFISNIIEYRIPFYIGFYVSIFKLFCKKNNLNSSFDFNIVDISDSLENKNLDEKYNNLLEYGFSLDMIKKLQLNNDNVDVLDEYEKIIFNDYKNLLS